ncbi:MAG TPA: secondary thiamine-phosphate synthase enzyme YjbQ [Gemmatimonadales bacterium]|nr:secondary thiamine-phosphate synthase enzyme YjbQ [Gemmatimonadales bacterium]
MLPNVSHGQTARAHWSFPLDAEFGHRNITPELSTLVKQSGVQDGLALVWLAGTTGGVTTMEYEPGALDDLRKAVRALAPVGAAYEHDRRQGDDNGFSHVRSALLKTDLAVPVLEGRLHLGTWQQVVVFNFDSRPRDRAVVAVVLGA